MVALSKLQHLREVGRDGLECVLRTKERFKEWGASIVTLDFGREGYHHGSRAVRAATAVDTTPLEPSLASTPFPALRVLRLDHGVLCSSGQRWIGLARPLVLCHAVVERRSS